MKIPPVFSLLDNPNAALEFFEIFRSRLSMKFVKRIHFDHSDCQTLGLDAQAIVDALVAEEVARRGDAGLILGGTYPKDAAIKVMLKAIGTLRMIGHPEMKLAAEIERRIERSDLQYGNGKELKQSAARDRAGSRLVDYFDRVLAHQGFGLSLEAKGELIVLLTEVIGNAEEHSGRWYTIGYSFPGKTRGNDGELECCQIVIFNFGRTIYDSLSSENADRDVKRRVEELVQVHHSRRHFNEWWTEEGLWTLAALQHGVTRYKKGERGATRGKGSIEMIRAFSELASSPKQMAIISGKTFILFDGSYGLRENEHGYQQIAFNENNDLTEAPNRNSVYALKKGFPGTIISCRFMIDRVHLEELHQVQG